MDAAKTVQEIKAKNRNKIISYVYDNGTVSRQDIARTLGLSLPTVLSNVNELLTMGMLVEVGEYASTGGRKAKRIAIQPDFRFTVGVDITKHHIRYLLFDLCGKSVSDISIRCNYADDSEYYDYLIKRLELFLQDNAIEFERVVGVGLSVPGIVDAENGILIRSHILGVSGVNLHFALREMPFPIWMDNDANCAAYAEVEQKKNNTAFFSLSYSLGGASYVDGKLHVGNNLRAGEFGHMLLHPGGKRCYCGKLGCLDAYCSVSALLDQQDESLDQFFQKVEYGSAEHVARWDEYLDNLAIAVTNVRMALDCEVVLGGYVGSYIGKYMEQLSRKTSKYNMFDQDASYIRVGKYKQISSAIGAAKMMAKRFFDSLSEAGHL